MKSTLVKVLSLSLPLALPFAAFAQGTVPTRPPGQQQPSSSTPATKEATKPADGSTPKVPTRQPGQQQPSSPTPATGGMKKPTKETVEPVGEAPAVKDDAGFVSAASTAGMGEVKLAQLAESKAGSKKVKAFAAMLVKDHTAANKKLKEVAASLKLPLGAEDPMAKEKHEALSAKKGEEFDAAFLEEMKMCHEKDIALFEAAKGVVKAPELAGFIEKTLPVIKSHAEKLPMSDSPKKDGHATEKTPAATNRR